jgi:GTP1/Obg family GTP-binding protein
LEEKISKKSTRRTRMKTRRQTSMEYLRSLRTTVNHLRNYLANHRNVASTNELPSFEAEVLDVTLDRLRIERGRVVSVNTETRLFFKLS